MKVNVSSRKLISATFNLARCICGTRFKIFISAKEETGGKYRLGQKVSHNVKC